MKKAWLCLVVALSFLSLNAQLTRHLVQFKNKGTSPYSFSNPAAYLSPRSIEKRARYEIAIDSTDLPVTPHYLDSLRSIPNIIILNVSKWLNQVSIQTTDAAALTAISNFTFVQSVSPIASRAVIDDFITGKFRNTSRTFQQQFTAKLTADFYSYGNAAAQVKIHNGQFLHNIGLRGQGMVISMLDAGFFNYTSLRSFDSINSNGQVLGTWDFVARETSVSEDHPHGMQCFSTIAANVPGQFVGTAPKAGFYLYRTEDAASEYPIEEHNWVCAAERVDSTGGDVISSSLGYYEFDNPSFNHPYSIMDGNTTIAARGADLAAKKGILVVNSAGNEGNKAWKYIITPADGDSVLAVGAVNAAGAIGAFSSYGPTADGQVKPDVVSVGVGTTIQLTNNNIGSGNGTSYAAPNLAGLATCLWQGFPELNNMKIIMALRQSSDRFTTPDERYGYGIPDVKKAFFALLKQITSATAIAEDCKAALSWTSKDVAGMRYEIERRGSTETEFKKVGEIAATASSFGTRTYTFTDLIDNIGASSYSYRIKQVIDTAVASFSADYIANTTVAITCMNTNNKTLQLFPNPTANRVSLQVNTTEAATLVIKVIDAAGKLVGEQKEMKGITPTVYPVSIVHLATGRYFVCVYANDKLIGTEQLVKL